VKTDITGRILVLGGTTEGRALLCYGLPIIYSVTTTYGAELAGENKNTQIVVGRMDSSELEKFIRESNIVCVIDATHPYASEAHDNIRAACLASETPLMRIDRKALTSTAGNIVRVNSIEEAADYIESRTGNVLLTTGSKNLEAYEAVNERSRLFARVLPDPEVIKKCVECGFDSGHIIAMQGPFSVLMNEEMIRMTKAQWLVTKDSGDIGGIKEKIEAAHNCNIGIILVERPQKVSGSDITESLLWACGILGINEIPGQCSIE
jgi:precorrin-6A/cobalt-precorrin-6A reductase